MEKLVVVVVVTLTLILKQASSITCPDQWFSYAGYCYRFEGDVPLSYDNARAACNVHGAGVVAVENLAEHTWITKWMFQYDPFQREWYTSGKKKTSTTEVGNQYEWESTGDEITLVVDSLWLKPPQDNTPQGVIAYGYGQSGIGLLWVDGSQMRAYICKISEREAYRIVVNTRSFDYGLPKSTSSATVERGPYFIVEPNSVVVVTDPESLASAPVVLDCVVGGYPQPHYRWFRGQNFDKEVTMDTDERVTITNGRLTIDRPNEDVDWDLYRCIAENQFGRVMSGPVEITFGALGDFNNVPDAGTRAKAFEGAILECSQITYKPAVSFQWMKGSEFVRPQYQDYIFISKNGKLYFSEVTRPDEASYRCIAVLMGVGSNTIGSGYAPMRTSLPIPLIIDNQAPKSEWGPEIQNDFIAVFPKPPLRGQDVALECFAYGTSTVSFIYSWLREDKPMPPTARTYDHNRVLVLENAQLEDSGTYRCTVSRGSKASDTKAVTLDLGAKPYFVSPLKNQHVDIDGQLTWICNARGNPAPTYKWFKDGRPLTSDSDSRIKVHQNVLSISNLNPDLHNGMYQCGAQNTHGESISNAQLRVLALPPSIEKFPPPSSVMASKGGNLTLRCHPEGSPSPTVEWSKGSSAITQSGDKYTILGNGNLHVAELTIGDQGVYTCKATNTYGTAQASSTVQITESVTVTISPSDDSAIVNETIFLPCQASHPGNLDMVYDWTFNNFPLDFRTGYYMQTKGGSQSPQGLYLLNVKLQNEGEYTCTVLSPFAAISRSAYITVKGPPRRPAGVEALQAETDTTSTVVQWAEGSSSGGSTRVHVIQIANEFTPNTWGDFMTVRVQDSIVESSVVSGRHSAELTGLNPGTAYRFRILAVNEYGRGLESDPSTFIQTKSAAPAVVPRNVRGGGGSVGVLTVLWDPLERSEYGTSDVDSVGYRIYWREKDATRITAQWAEEIVYGANINKLVRYVGEEKYYLLYETKVHAFNDIGSGPNTTVHDVYSAETLPLAVPENVNTNTFNSTAIEVFWDPVPQLREYAGGVILGYQINYWKENEDQSDGSFIRYYGQRDAGLVIGLDVDENYIIDVQVYNSAGLGSRSNRYLMETSGFAPLNYPQEVRIWSAGGGRAFLWWRGISITVEEEALVGYAIWVWPANEDPRGAEMIEIPGMAFHYVLGSLERNTLYALRLAAVGGGGYGKKTPTIYFTIEGQITIDSRFAETIEVLSGCMTLQATLSLLVVSIMSSAFSCMVWS